MGGTKKIWMNFSGRSVLEWTLFRFLEAGVTQGVIVAQLADHSRIISLCRSLGLSRMTVVEGGRERYLSVMAGLDALCLAQSQDVVLIHDAARFLVTSRVIERVIEAAATTGAALPVIEVVDTIKEVASNGHVLRTIPRQSLGMAQTPQGFHKELLERAYALWEGLEVPTDDAEVAERAGIAVQVVTGDPKNQKLTRPEDVAWFMETLKGLIT